MTILSIDVGEKNFAYCIGDKESIYSWKKHNVLKKKSQTVIVSCIAISKILDEEKDLINNCDTIVIEQQMRANIRAQRIGQHIWSWLFAKYPSKKILFFPSHRKTQYFLGKNTLSDKERKNWSVSKVREILKTRNDTVNSCVFEHIEGKKDDVADAFLQMIVYLAEKT